MKDRILKEDSFGSVRIHPTDSGVTVIRDTRTAAWWARWLARRLARREAQALQAAASLKGLPRLLGFDGCRLSRTFLPGEAMHEARPVSQAYFRDALTLLRRLHRCGVVHNDLAKEPNWLCLANGQPGLIDFQLALVTPHRHALFRALAREDLRHLLKHKRTYVPQALTTRQRAILDRPSLLTRTWRALIKPAYLFITRKILGWPERDGPAERVR